MQKIPITTEYKISICSDSALAVEFVNDNKYIANECARDFERTLLDSGYDWVSDTKVMMTSVIVVYNPCYRSYKKVNAILGKTAKRVCKSSVLPKQGEKQTVHCIPVFYSVDTDAVCSALGLTRDEFIKAHSGRDYLACTVLQKGVVRLKHTCFREEIRVEKKEIVRGSLVFDGKYTYIATENTVSDLPVVAKTFIDPFDSQTGETFCKVGEYVRFISVGENKFKKLSDKGEYETDTRRVSGGDDQ